MTPQSKLPWKEFERLLLLAGARLEAEGVLSIGKYGVKVAGIIDGKPQRVIPSLPDLEGAWAPHGRQVIIEAKVTASASLSLLASSAKVTSTQIRHLIRRSRVGVGCWLVVHWNARELVRRTIPAVTTAIPVRWDDRWQAIDRNEIKSISQETALQIGISLPWVAEGRAKVLVPDLRLLAPVAVTEDEVAL